MDSGVSFVVNYAGEGLVLMESMPKITTQIGEEIMKRLLTCCGLALMVMAVPAQAIDPSTEVSPPKSRPEASPPVAPAPAVPPVTPPNASEGGDAKSAPPQSPMRDYCREHTC